MGDKINDRSKDREILEREFLWFFSPLGGQGTAPHSGNTVNCEDIYEGGVLGNPSWRKEVKSWP